MEDFISYQINSLDQVDLKSQSHICSLAMWPALHGARQQSSPMFRTNYSIKGSVPPNPHWFAHKKNQVTSRFARILEDPQVHQTTHAWQPMNRHKKAVTRRLQRRPTLPANLPTFCTVGDTSAVHSISMQTLQVGHHQVHTKILWGGFVCVWPIRHVQLQGQVSCPKTRTQ